MYTEFLEVYRKLRSTLQITVRGTLKVTIYIASNVRGTLKVTMYIVQYCKRYTESYNVQYCTSALQNMKNEYTECEELFIKVKGITH